MTKQLAACVQDCGPHHVLYDAHLELLQEPSGFTLLHYQSQGLAVPAEEELQVKQL